MKTHIKRLTLSDARRCLDLTEAVKWSQTLDDWKRLLSWSGDGAYGMMHRTSTLAATTLVFRYGIERAWIGTVITHPRFQRQGLATQLMETAMAGLKREGVREIMLDATQMGQPLYEKFGFRVVYPVDIFMGAAVSQPRAAAERYQPAHLTELLALDREVFGADRSRILKTLLKDFPAWVDYEGDVLQGYLIGQIKDVESAHIGPWIHRSPQGAEKLLQTALNHLAGRVIRLDIAEKNQNSQDIAIKYGFEKKRSCSRMIFGEATPTIHHALYYSKAMFATG